MDPDERARRLWFASFVVLCVVVTVIAGMRVGMARAQDAPLPSVTGDCTPELTVNRRAQIPNAGADGIWFAMPLARCMLDRLTALPLYAERASLLEQRLVLSDRLTSIVREEQGLAVREADAARGALEAAVTRAREAEEDRDKWYRSPAFWALVGIAGTVLVEVVSVLLLREVSP